ncbi:MAG TPA: hypothetical protein DIS88_10510 [Prevotella sp.]|nr:hypothetical protein [Prevotella sp.]
MNFKDDSTMKRSYISPKAVVVKINLYNSFLVGGDFAYSIKSTPEYSGGAGAKPARLSDSNGDYSSETTESWDE